MKIDKPELIELEISDLSRGGAGVGREGSGRVVFVPLTAPGDVVRVRVHSLKKNYAQGDLIELVKASPQRQDPPCPVFGKCGGCSWQHLQYELQWKTKARGVKQALKRVGINPDSLTWTEMPAEQIWNYRNRIQLRGEHGSIGFYALGSHTLVPIQDCKIARPELNDQLAVSLKEGLERFQGEFKLELSVDSLGHIKKAWNERHAATGFAQVHDLQNEKLKNWVSQALIEDEERDVLFDLYGGSGNLSVLLVEKFKRVFVVDLGAPKVRPEGVPSHVSFHTMKVLEWLKGQNTTDTKRGSAIVDPPRDGLGGELTPIANELKKRGVKTVVTVGCDPDSWARDMANWEKCGWRIARCGILDLFPQTPHVEAVGLLRL